jgi:6-phosphogluconolactonase (cycloisomerase 2 family)
MLSRASMHSAAASATQKHNIVRLTVSPHVPRVLLGFMVILFIICSLPSFAQQPSLGGAVFVMTNRAEGNSVAVYRRAADGGLQFLQDVPTRGLGTGVTLDPLMSQGALALSDNGTLLLAVNPVSGDVSSFIATSNGLVFASKASSSGALPVSVAIHGHLAYVLNQLGAASISGFTLTSTGRLQPIPNSTRVLAGGPLAQPAQVSFTPDGGELLVTEKGTDLVDVFHVQANGLTTGPTVVMSSGKTPFGFALTATALVISEAERRFPMRGTTSSYQLGNDGALTPVSNAVPNTQTAACWVAITGDIAWVVNTGSGTISSYQVGANGSLTLLNSAAASLGPTTTPIDLAATADGQFVYVLESAVGKVAAFRVNGSSLSPLFTESGLPLSIQGIVAR